MALLAPALLTPALPHLAFAGSTRADTLDLSAYAGQVVYLDLWASWCTPCLKSFPWMQAMHRKYSDEGLAVIAVNVDRDPEAAAAFLKKHPVDFRIVFDTHAELARRYKLDAMPTSFLYDRDGTLIATHRGFWTKTGKELETSIRELLVKSE